MQMNVLSVSLEFVSSLTSQILLILFSFNSDFVVNGTSGSVFCWKLGVATSLPQFILLLFGFCFTLFYLIPFVCFSWKIAQQVFNLIFSPNLSFQNLLVILQLKKNFSKGGRIENVSEYIFIWNKFNSVEDFFFCSYATVSLKMNSRLLNKNCGISWCLSLFEREKKLCSCSLKTASLELAVVWGGFLLVVLLTFL